MRPTPWLPFSGPPDSRLRLFCFPHAGAGASAFRDWMRVLAPAVAVIPVQLPGRETRFRERPYTRVDPLVADLVPTLTPELSRPYAFFGHSLGALVAFETARALRRAGCPGPLHLTVSGRIAPQLADSRPPLNCMPGDQLIVELRRLGGMPDRVLGDGALLAALLPTLRADLEINESYTYRPEAPLPIPLTVIGGTGDARVRPEDLDVWRAQTERRFARHCLPGGHFAVLGQPDRWLAGARPSLGQWIR